MRTSQRFRGWPQLTPLAACLTALFGLSASGVACATTWTVDSCDDATPTGTGNASAHTGNLRFTTLHAATGDTIDLASPTLGCSRITLNSGFLYLQQNDLTVVGPTTSQFTISGLGTGLANSSFSMFNHVGTGTLELENLTVANGYYYGSVNTLGACIYSTANVVLSKTTVTNCQLVDVGDIPPARGGGVYTKGNLTLENSVVTGNSAKSTGSTAARGGGVYVKGNLVAMYSTISDNYAYAIPSAPHSSGGGAFVHGYVHLYSSTVSGNEAKLGLGGGMTTQNNLAISSSTISGNAANNAAGFNATGTSTRTATISNSTISGNTATGNYGGAYSNLAMTISDSSLVFNKAASKGGLTAYGATLDLQSSIIANNSASGSTSDLDAKNTTTVSGGNNVIITSSVTPPPETITTCPFMGKLRDNGGPTFTNALLTHSSAIAKGNNVAALPFDQRGTGFARISTGESVADAGAYEVQQNDIIFNNAFDGCL